MCGGALDECDVAQHGCSCCELPAVTIASWIPVPAAARVLLVDVLEHLLQGLMLLLLARVSDDTSQSLA
jgi:hypothetical protein